MKRFPVVVLEGPDGGGKTTLATTLATLGYTVRHEGPPPDYHDRVLEYYVGKLTMALVDSMAAGVVLDRFALGERVYGPILRGKDRLGSKDWSTMRDCLDAVGALRVLCLPPVEICFQQWIRRNAAGEEIISRQDVFLETYAAWRNLRHDRGQIVYDWTRPGAESAFLSLITEVAA